MQDALKQETLGFLSAAFDGHFTIEAAQHNGSFTDFSAGLLLPFSNARWRYEFIHVTPNRVSPIANSPNPDIRSKDSFGSRTMQQAMASRKRAAPGASPMVQQQPTPPQPSYQYAPPPQQVPESNDFSNFDFSQPMFSADQGFPTDPTVGDSSNFSASAMNASQLPTYGSLPQSTDLVRRTRNQQIAPPGQEQWNGSAFSNTHARNEEEDEQDLDMKVAMAKRDAQGKRKQIPPFVQKLSR